MPMTLKNVLGISLDAVPPDPAAIGKLPAAARALQGHVLAWLKAHRPDLLPG